GRARRMHVAAAPLAGHGGVRVLGRAAALLCFRHQRLVVLLRGLERIRTHDRFAREIAVAVTPGRRRGALVRDQALAVRTPLLFDRGGAVAAEVALVGPERLVLVEILRREEVDGERRDSGRRGSAAGRADERAARTRRAAASATRGRCARGRLLR